MKFLFIFLVLLGSLNSQDSDSTENKDGNVESDNVEVEPSYFATSHPVRDSKDLHALDLKPSDDVQTSFKIIPLHNESLLFYLGDKVEILLGFENIGENDLYITDVSGALVSPYDNNVFAFNNTAVHHNITAKYHEYHSFYYPFLISQHSNPIDYGVVAFIYYVNARGDEFRSVVVNTTLNIKDAPSAIKAGKFFLIILVIAVVLTLVIVFRKQIYDFLTGLYRRFVTKGKGRSSSGKRTGGRARSPGENAGDDDDGDDWLKNTSTRAFQKNQQREKEREKEKGKKSGGGKRDISQSPNPGQTGQRTKRGRSPPNDSGATVTGDASFVLKNQ